VKELWRFVKLLWHHIIVVWQTDRQTDRHRYLCTA